MKSSARLASSVLNITPEESLRVGLLGYSDIARRKFIPALLQSRKASLVAVGSMNREPVSLANGKLADFMTYKDLVCNPLIDLIYISLPNHLHEEWCIRALKQGKHVICEKPLGLSADSVKRILDVAEAHGRLLYENLMYLQHPQHMAVMALISSGRIGKLLTLRSEFAFPGPAAGDFRLDPAKGGGAFHDMNRYPLSAALFLLKGKTHRFIRGSLEERAGLNLSLQAESVTDAGESFTFMTAFGLPYRSFYEIGCELGSIRVDRAFTTPAEMENQVSVTVDGADESFRVPPSDHFLGTIEHVCALIHSNVWGKEHGRSMKLAELAGMFHDNCARRGHKHETD